MESDENSKSEHHQEQFVSSIPSDYVAISELSLATSYPEKVIVDLIQRGNYEGIFVGGEWYVNKKHLKDKSENVQRRKGYLTVEAFAQKKGISAEAVLSGIAQGSYKSIRENGEWLILKDHDSDTGSSKKTSDLTSFTGPHGPEGWLTFFKVTLFLGVLMAFGNWTNEFTEAEKLYPSVNEMTSWSIYKFLVYVWITLLGCFALLSRTALNEFNYSAVRIFITYVLVAFTFLTIFLLHIIFPWLTIGFVDGESFGLGLVQAVFWFTIWQMYFAMSKRVKNTYHDQTVTFREFLVALKKQYI